MFRSKIGNATPTFNMERLNEKNKPQRSQDESVAVLCNSIFDFIVEINRTNVGLSNQSKNVLNIITETSKTKQSNGCDNLLIKLIDEQAEMSSTKKEVLFNFSPPSRINIVKGDVDYNFEISRDKQFTLDVNKVVSLINKEVRQARKTKKTQGEKEAKEPRKLRIAHQKKEPTKASDINEDDVDIHSSSDETLLITINKNGDTEHIEDIFFSDSSSEEIGTTLLSSKKITVKKDISPPVCIDRAYQTPEIITTYLTQDNQWVKDDERSQAFRGRLKEWLEEKDSTNVDKEMILSVSDMQIVERDDPKLTVVIITSWDGKSSMKTEMICRDNRDALSLRERWLSQKSLLSERTEVEPEWRSVSGTIRDSLAASELSKPKCNLKLPSAGDNHNQIINSSDKQVERILPIANPCQTNKTTEIITTYLTEDDKWVRDDKCSYPYREELQLFINEKDYANKNIYEQMILTITDLQLITTYIPEESKIIIISSDGKSTRKTEMTCPANVDASALRSRLLCQQLLLCQEKQQYPLCKNMTNLVLPAVSFKGLTIDGTDFSNSDLRLATDMNWSPLMKHVNFSYANLSGLDLSYMNLNSCIFFRSVLHHTDFKHSTFSCSGQENFVDALTTGARFNEPFAKHHEDIFSSESTAEKKRPSQIVRPVNLIRRHSA